MTIKDNMISDYGTGEQATILGSFRAFQQYKIYYTTQNEWRIIEKES